MEDLMVRDGEISEMAMVRKQRLEAYQQYIGVLDDFHWEALSGTLISDSDLEPGVEIILAESNKGELLGSVVLFPAKSMAYGNWTNALDYPELRMLAVSPSARGKGVGTLLVNECIKRTKARGYKKMGLHTGSFMREAMKLYEGMGFVRVPEQDFEPANDGIVVQGYVIDLS